MFGISHRTSSSIHSARNCHEKSPWKCRTTWYDVWYYFYHMQPEKYCSRCGDDKADGYIKYCFQKYKNGTSKQYYHCRKCNRERTKKYYTNNSDRVRAIIKKSIQRHHYKHLARSAVGNAIRAGTIVRPDTCSRCEAVGIPIQGHHTDYSRPLDVQWLCISCHADADRVLQ